MVGSVWALASVTDQGVRGAEGRESRNRQTSFSTGTQTTLVVTNSRRLERWWLGMGLLDHTFFETSPWWIVLWCRATPPATLIYQPSSIFTCNLIGPGSLSDRPYYRLGLCGIDLIDWKQSNLKWCIIAPDLWRFDKRLYLFQSTGF